ncbi:MAG: heavy-metal-associated domain-containing protein, partial [Bacteroidales bacterium]|nr:heavy-metal-associated domain-containing protein [Bacteroidales bacterium]
MTKERYRISGMHCANCAARIEKAIAATVGVDFANVNFAMEQLVVTYDPDRITNKAIIRTVNRLGFKLFPVDRDIFSGHIRQLTISLYVSIALTIPMLLSMLLMV